MTIQSKQGKIGKLRFAVLVASGALLSACSNSDARMAEKIAAAQAAADRAEDAAKRAEAAVAKMNQGPQQTMDYSTPEPPQGSQPQPSPSPTPEPEPEPDSANRTQ